MAGMITALLLIPLIGALIVAAFPERFARGVSLLFNVIAFSVAIVVWRNFDTSAGGLQFIERHAWIPTIGAEYFVGVDGLSLLLVLLTALVVPFALLAQRSASRAYCALTLVMQTALFGAFTAQ